MVMETEGVKERGEGAGFEMALCPVARDIVARDKHHGGGVVMLLLMPNYLFLLSSGVKPVLSSARGGGTSMAVAAFFETFFPLFDENDHDKKEVTPLTKSTAVSPSQKHRVIRGDSEYFPAASGNQNQRVFQHNKRLGLAATHGRIKD